tara:strand:- start:508 stop:753 length:246 start_codon:yes stop_codon:yes gene_type:complete
MPIAALLLKIVPDKSRLGWQVLGRNPTGRALYFGNLALQRARVASLHNAYCALSCKKIERGATISFALTGASLVFAPRARV